MKRQKTSPYALDDYLASGYEETENPFITANSREWGRYVSIIGSVGSAIFLLAAYITRGFSFDLSSFFLIFVYFLAGTPSLIRSLQNIYALNINISVLMTLAALLSALIGQELEGGLLLVLFYLSEALEDAATKKTKGSLNALHKLSPTMAFVVGNDKVVYPKSVREIPLDTKILVKAGEIVPLDGRVVEGSSFVNLSHLTGESVPISKKPGDDVQAGSLNTDGTITLIVTKTSADSTLSKIIQLITEAHEAKPKLQRFLDRFSKTYATTVILLSLSFAVFLPLLFAMPYIGTEGSIYRALAFLIAASPCALIIATPTAYLSAISACARKGVLLKGGVVLDAMAKCKVLAFDKTGTLTTGKLKIQETYLDGEGFSGKFAVGVAAGLERAVVHPIANAILDYATSQDIPLIPIEDLKVIAGSGVEGYFSYQNRRVYGAIGNVDFILQKLNDPSRSISLKSRLTHEGHVTTLLLMEKSVMVFHLLDEIRPELEETIHQLAKKIDLVMLTGDHLENAQFVAGRLGITTVHANLKPEDKLRLVTDLAQKHPLIMVGDGINDAPALTRAMVGIAMGQVGSATAVEAADVVLLRDDIAEIGWLYNRSKKTVRIVRQNLTLALAVIGVATTCSLLGFIPLWLAVVLHEGSTVTVGFNSLRLLRK